MKRPGKGNICITTRAMASLTCEYALNSSFISGRFAKMLSLLNLRSIRLASSTCSRCCAAPATESSCKTRGNAGAAPTPPETPGNSSAREAPPRSPGGRTAESRCPEGCSPRTALGCFAFPALFPTCWRSGSTTSTWSPPRDEARRTLHASDRLSRGLGWLGETGRLREANACCRR